MIPKLPDPRRYARGGRHPLLDLAAEVDAEIALVNAFRERLDRRADAEVRQALGLAPDRESYGRLWRALCAAVESAADLDEAIVTAVFAMPIVIVSGARLPASLPGALGDVDALADVLSRAGALGASRSFGFSNALCSLDTLERLAPSTVREWRMPGAQDVATRAVAPEAVPIRPGEEVHLRFLLGATVSPATAPSVTETAAHIGSWGMAFARALRGQLATPGVDLLALPRPPAGVLSATYRGRRAQLDVALDLFLSNAIRRMRAAAGEPSLVISVHEAGDGAAELRVSMSAALDDTLLEGFRWPLHPLDDLDELAGNVRQLAADCRLTDVRLVRSVLPVGGNGSPLYIRAADAPAAGPMLS
ncbi:MAG TPA: hypothetical protein VFC14_21060 [Burkholderiales bacterium]|nr:hypothetical protein [Burkholderiales bacterium]